MDRLALLADHAVRSAFAGELGWDIEFYPSIASTQDRARQLGRDALPRETADIATTLARAGHDIDRLALLARLTKELDAIAAPAARDDALAEWRKRSITVGREVEVTITAKERIRGTASGLADDGAL